VLLSLFYFLSLSRISEKSENSHHAKIVNYTTFSEFLQMVPKHNFIGPFKLFLFIGQAFWEKFNEASWKKFNEAFMENLTKLLGKNLTKLFGKI
jgi:hypothetical protein